MSWSSGAALVGGRDRHPADLGSAPSGRAHADERQVVLQHRDEEADGSGRIEDATALSSRS